MVVATVLWLVFVVRIWGLCGGLLWLWLRVILCS